MLLSPHHRSYIPGYKDYLKGREKSKPLKAYKLGSMENVTRLTSKHLDDARLLPCTWTGAPLCLVQVGMGSAITATWMNVIHSKLFLRLPYFVPLDVNWKTTSFP